MASKSAAEKLLWSQKQRFVALFCTGPERLRGSMDDCNKTLGTAFDFCDEDIRRLVSEEGMPVPQCGSKVATIIDAPQHAKADDKALSDKHHEQENTWRKRQVTEEADKDKAEWCKQYQELKPTIDAIARGETKSNAAQSRIIAMVTERCFGKVVAEQEAKEQSHVMLLPMIGSGANAMICPHCGYVKEELSDGEEQGTV